MFMRRHNASKGTRGIGGAIVSLFGGGSSKFDFNLTQAEWRERLTPAQFHVMREHGTELPGSSPLADNDQPGTYQCAACAQPLYSSETKFDSCGWPSFSAPIDGAVATSTDFQLIVPRKEVHCSCCGGHLGHVFGDGPKPTGQRHCINGVALSFVPE